MAVEQYYPRPPIFCTFSHNPKARCSSAQTNISAQGNMCCRMTLGARHCHLIGCQGGRRRLALIPSSHTAGQEYILSQQSSLACSLPRGSPLIALRGCPSTHYKKNQHKDKSTLYQPSTRLHTQKAQCLPLLITRSRDTNPNLLTTPQVSRRLNLETTLPPMLREP